MRLASHQCRPCTAGPHRINTLLQWVAAGAPAKQAGGSWPGAGSFLSLLLGRHFSMTFPKGGRHCRCSCVGTHAHSAKAQPDLLLTLGCALVSTKGFNVFAGEQPEGDALSVAPHLWRGMPGCGCCVSDASNTPARRSSVAALLLLLLPAGLSFSGAATEAAGFWGKPSASSPCRACCRRLYEARALLCTAMAEQRVSVWMPTACACA